MGHAAMDTCMAAADAGASSGQLWAWTIALIQNLDG